MKQNSQWLSHVRIWSNRALSTSAPSGSPARFSAVRVSSSPPRRRSTSTSASSVRSRHRRMSRGTSPLSRSTSSPGTMPARAAGDAGATATTRGGLISPRNARSWPSQASDHPLGSLDDVDVDRVLLASPRGFCAGVEMAIKALAWMVRTFEPPIYCYHEIVHNKLVVDRFTSLGVIFVDDVAAVPEGRPIMLSAHGSAPQVVEAARRRGSYVVGSVCPLVTKVHHEVKVRAGKGYQVVYGGHEGHEEAVGTMAVAPDAIHRVESVPDVAALPAFSGPVALLAQTTLSHRDWEDVATAAKERYPGMWTPGRSDLCFATTNRQSALMAMAPRCSAIVVIGSANSSNTRALEKLAVEAGCPRVYRINHADELPTDLSGVVGV